MSAAGKKESTVGQLVNLMSVDVQRVTDDVDDWHLIWSGPFLTIIASVMLWQELGEAMN